jgi:hypothetical protein
MDDLIAFLNARLDEDERTAKAVAWDGSGNTLSWDLIASATVEVGEDEFGTDDRTVANHIVSHDPARVLREVASKRRIADLAHRVPKVAAPTDLFDNSRDAWGEVLKQLALSYSDHPEYRQEWAP